MPTMNPAIRMYGTGLEGRARKALGRPGSLAWKAGTEGSSYGEAGVGGGATPTRDSGLGFDGRRVAARGGLGGVEGAGRPAGEFADREDTKSASADCGDCGGV